MKTLWMTSAGAGTGTRWTVPSGRLRTQAALRRGSSGRGGVPRAADGAEADAGDMGRRAKEDEVQQLRREVLPWPATPNLIDQSNWILGPLLG